MTGKGNINRWKRNKVNYNFYPAFLAIQWMLVLMNSNQYCILVICYANEALQQYYPMQKLTPLTKPQKLKSICPYYKGKGKKEHRTFLEFELVLQRYLFTFQNNSHNLKILIPRCFWNTKPKFTKDSLFKNYSRKSEPLAYVKGVYSHSIVRTKSISPLWMKKKEKETQTTGTGHIEAWSEYRGRMVKPHVIPAIKARKTRCRFSPGMLCSVIFENNTSAAAWQT